MTQTVVLEGVWPTLDIVGLFVGYVYMQLKIRYVLIVYCSNLQQQLNKHQLCVRYYLIACGR
jgi:hypothetical protein